MYIEDLLAMARTFGGGDTLQADALDFDLSGYDFIWASPPCQAYSVGTKRWNPDQYPDLIAPVRERLEQAGVAYVIENVPGSPLRQPVRLCGAMFGLRVVRHRHFESNVQLYVPKHRRHHEPVFRPALDGTDRTVKRSWYMTVAGHGGHSSSYKLADWKAAMGIDWMNRSELIEAIPPAYSEFIGKQAMCLKPWSPT